jgi:phytanoyl-CoA dioxygenase PhyH
VYTCRESGVWLSAPWYKLNMDESEIKHFQAFGFVVFRNAFNAGPLRDEVDRALDAGCRRSTGTGVAEVQYLPMMSPRTPCSLSLLDRFETAAAALVGGPVLPVRAKGIRYVGSTPWHTDSSRPVASIGLAAYLDRLNGENGALRVLPGSHRGEYGSIVAAYLASVAPGAAVESFPAVALPTSPAMSSPSTSTYSTRAAAASIDSNGESTTFATRSRPRKRRMCERISHTFLSPIGMAVMTWTLFQATRQNGLTLRVLR